MKLFIVIIALLMLVGCGEDNYVYKDVVVDHNETVDTYTVQDEDTFEVADNDTTEPIFKNVSNSEANDIINLHDGKGSLVIIDVRTEGEFASGHIKDAVNMNKFDATFESDLSTLNKKHTYLIYCATGSRSASTLTSMQTMEFKEVYNLTSGFNSWKNDGYPVEN